MEASVLQHLRGSCRDTRMKVIVESIRPKNYLWFAASDTATLTLNGKRTGDARDEAEYPIPWDDADQLLKSYCVKPLLRKIRYAIETAGGRFEVDEFQCENHGLVIGELEGQNDLTWRPEWLGDEVTDDDRYLNLSLVSMPYSQWKGPQREWLIVCSRMSPSRRESGALSAKSLTKRLSS
jgi:adenylate cyclase